MCQMAFDEGYLDNPIRKAFISSRYRLNRSLSPTMANGETSKRL